MRCNKFIVEIYEGKNNDYLACICYLAYCGAFLLAFIGWRFLPIVFMYPYCSIFVAGSISSVITYLRE